MPSEAFLRGSERLWKGRHTRYRRRRRAALARGDRRYAERMEAKADRAAAMLRRRRLQLEELQGPEVITAAELGLSFQFLWGGKGAPINLAGHYDAGAQVTSRAALLERVASVHRHHLNVGFGGGSYEVVVWGRHVVCLNPMARKSAAVRGMNTGMVSIMVPGTAGDRMDPVTRSTVRWVIDNWHTNRFPAAHRLSRPARQLNRRGHKEFPGQATSCPDLYLIDYREAWQ